MEDLKNNSTFEDTEWDTSIADCANVMTNRWPDWVIRTEKCLRSLAKNKIKRSDTKTIKRYARKYELNEAKILLMY